MRPLSRCNILSCEIAVSNLGSSSAEYEWIYKLLAVAAVRKMLYEVAPINDQPLCILEHVCNEHQIFCTHLKKDI